MDFQILSSGRLDRFFIHPSYVNRCGELPPANYYANIAARSTRASTPNTALLSWESSLTVDRRASCINVVRNGGRHLFDLAEENTGNKEEEEEEGPIELPRGLNPFEVPDATPLQKTASVLLTGAIALLLYRSVKRRAKRATEMKFRSSGVESVREEAKSEALKSLKKLKVNQDVKVAGSPSAIQTLLGAVIAGVIAFVLYNFTISVESALEKQAISTNYSIRQVTITIRTILNGICYLATFVFALNSVGLTLYSAQLATKSWIDIFKGESDSRPMESKSEIDVEVKDEKE